MARKVRSRQGWNKVRTIFAPPEWIPAGETPYAAQTYRPYDALPRPRTKAIAAGIFLATLCLGLIIESGADQWQAAPQVIITAFTAGLAWIAMRLFDGGWSKAERKAIPSSVAYPRSHRDGV